jgi:hypothetical protein
VVQSGANIKNVVTETEFSNEVMLFTKKEFEEYDYTVYSVKSLSGDFITLNKDDHVYLDVLWLGQGPGVSQGAFNADIECISHIWQMTLSW